MNYHCSKVKSTLNANNFNDYEYYGDGFRSDKISPQQAGEKAGFYDTDPKQTSYFYDESGRLISEQSAYFNQGIPQYPERVNTAYVYLGDLPIVAFKKAAPYFIVNDRLNTPRRLENMTKKTVWRWDYGDGFGANLPNEYVDNDKVKIEMNLRFPGQVYDKETGTHYNVFRDYDPQSGRYLQADPIGLSGGMNRWGYVRGNPLTSVDPLGLPQL